MARKKEKFLIPYSYEHFATTLLDERTVEALQAGEAFIVSKFSLLTAHDCMFEFLLHYPLFSTQEQHALATLRHAAEQVSSAFYAMGGVHERDRMLQMNNASLARMAH